MRKTSHKSQRINGEVQKELSRIIRMELKDPRINPMTSVTDVMVTQDLKYCKAYISVLGDAESGAETLKGLEQAIQEGVAYFVIIAEDASGNTQKKFMDKCKYYEIPYTIAFDSTTLGRQIGKQERTVLAVTDAGLAKQISDKLD